MAEVMIRTGIGGWTYPDWRGGMFYPKGLRQADEQAYATRAVGMIEINATFSSQWPNVTRNAGQTPADADEHKGEEGKYDKYFSPEPGKGD